MWNRPLISPGRHLAMMEWAGKFDRNLPWLYRRIRRWEYPDRHLPSTADRETAATSQATYSEAWRANIGAAGREFDRPALPVHLSHHPIAKNIRQIATAVHLATRLGRRLEIAAGNPREESFFAREGKGDWHPWLWGRIERARASNAPAVSAGSGDEPSDLWGLYFRNQPGADIEVNDVLAREDRRIPRWQRKVLEMAICCTETFRLNDLVAERVDAWRRAMDWPVDAPVLGLHVRRGDAASEDLDRSTRRSQTLEEYLAAADRICSRYDIRTIYLSTESQQEVDRARTLRPSHRILALPHDRSVFPTIESESRFIEDVALDDPGLVEPLVVSALADLHLLGESSAFIGTFNSEFSMLGWLLCIGRNREVVPYIDLTTHLGHQSFQGRLDFWMDPPSD